MLRIHLTILALKRRYVYIITYSFSNRFQTDFKPFIEIHWNDKFTVGFWLTLNPILLLISFHPFLPTDPQPSQPIYFFVLLLAFKAKLMGWGKPWRFWWLYVKLVKQIGKFRSNQWRPTPQVICLTNFQCSRVSLVEADVYYKCLLIHTQSKNFEWVFQLRSHIAPSLKNLGICWEPR